MKSVQLKLGDRSYPVLTGQGILDRAIGTLEPGRGFLLADSRLKPHARTLERALSKRGWTIETHLVPAREELKDIRKIYPIYARMLEARLDRHSTLFALGGGTIGDAAGFIAATYMRGIAWVGLPTTLLAQVDSAIGGKTGINHSAGKNLIGAFHQPALVVNELGFLRTLDSRDRISGLGEMVKYGLIADKALFAKLEKNWKKLVFGAPAALEDVVARCAALKARAVERDEHDRQGIRETLNFGHTVGHAIEALSGYGVFRHGEAVILGMRAAARISLLRGHLRGPDFERIDTLLKAFPVPPIPRKLSADRLMETIARDKKARDGKVRFVLLQGIGKTVLDREVGRDEILASVKGISK